MTSPNLPIIVLPVMRLAIPLIRLIIIIIIAKEPALQAKSNQLTVTAKTITSHECMNLHYKCWSLSESGVNTPNIRHTSAGSGFWFRITPFSKCIRISTAKLISTDGHVSKKHST